MKFQILTLATLVTYCSALSVFTGTSLTGKKCDFGTPVNECVNVPSACSGRVNSIRLHNDWNCIIYEQNGCLGKSQQLWSRNVNNLEDLQFKDITHAVKCWQV
ncbi:hypothetical protein BGZ50_008164 [Haplosporangium sp. Z 11]|nr:hypothetical protein BGZ50_008164 [Haplosporangium sp. Z 11]